MEIEFFAGTTWSRFAEWLNHYTQIAKTRLNADDGSFYGLHVPPERTRSNPDSAEIVINAYHAHEGLYDSLPGVFRFEILQLVSERIKVVASCSIMLPVFVGYFEALLKEIAKTWPETKADFRKREVKQGDMSPEETKLLPSNIKIIKRAQLSEFPNSFDEAIQAQFFLNTSLDDFVKWLERYSATLNERPFYTKKGIGYLQKARAYSKMQIPGLSVWHIDVLMHYPDEIVSVTAMEFEIEKLTQNRLKIKAVCTHPGWTSSYFSELLREIEVCWPNTENYQPRAIALAIAEANKLIKEIDEKTPVPPEETFMQKSAFLYPGNIDQAKDTIERYINESNKAQTTPTDYLSFKHIPLKPHPSSLLQATDSLVIYSGDDPNPICVLSLCPGKVATSIYCDETGPKGLAFWNDLCHYMQPRWELQTKLGEKFIPRFIHYPRGLTQEFPGYTVTYDPPPTVEDDPQQSTSLTSAEVVPWEKILDYRWDRAALELWWQGYECKEIADKIEEEVTDKTVRNRLSQLRRSYGEDIVPTDRQRRKLGIKVRTSGY